jgi:hypothetical protein
MEPGNTDETLLHSILPAGDGEQVDPDSLEGHKLGMSKRVQGYPSPIPGGKDHILNAQTVRQRVEAPNPADFPETPDVNAHGVPPASHHGFTRAQIMRGKGANEQPDTFYTEQKRAVRPIPVTIVENERRAESWRDATFRATQIPANTGDARQIVGRDTDRVEVLLLNEDATNAVRIGGHPGELVTTADVGEPPEASGALLPAGMTKYQALPTQGEIWAISATGTAPTISVIQVFDRKGSGL